MVNMKWNSKALNQLTQQVQADIGEIEVDLVSDEDTAVEKFAAALRERGLEPNLEGVREQVRTIRAAQQDS